MAYVKGIKNLILDLEKQFLWHFVESGNKSGAIWQFHET